MYKALRHTAPKGECVYISGNTQVPAQPPYIVMDTGCDCGLNFCTKSYTQHHNWNPLSKYTKHQWWVSNKIISLHIKAHDSESRGQEEAGRVRRTSELFTCSTAVKLANALIKLPLKLSLSYQGLSMF